MKRILFGISMFLSSLSCFCQQDSAKFSIPEVRKIAEIIIDHKSMKKELQVCDSIIFYQSGVIQSQDSVITLKEDQFQASQGKIKDLEKDLKKSKGKSKFLSWLTPICLGLGVIIGRII